MERSGKIVVVVEDDDSLHQALSRYLSAAGHQVEIFDCAEALLARSPMPRVDCYVLDVHLPGKSGTDLLRELTASGSTAPAIFITARDEPAVREAVIGCGGAALLIKPFAGRMLLATLAKLFRDRP